MEINQSNYREVLIRYLENELDATGRSEAEAYIKAHDAAAKEWELLQQTRLKPNLGIRFPGKKLLFRTEEPLVELKNPVVFRLSSFYRYTAVAAAAAVLAFVVILSFQKPAKKIETAQSGTKNNESPALQKPEIHPPSISTQPAKAVAQEMEQSKTAATHRVHKIPMKKPLLAENPQEYTGPVYAITHPESSDYNIGHKIEPIVQSVIPPMQTPLADVKPVKHNPSVHKTKKAINADPIENEDQTVFQSVVGLLHKVSIKKEIIHEQTYYGLSFESQDIKIDKKIKF